MDRHEYDAALAALDRRLKELEADRAEASGAELSALRRELERLKAEGPPGRPPTAAPAEPASPAAYKDDRPRKGGRYRGLRDPIAARSAYRHGETRAGEGAREPSSGEPYRKEDRPAGMSESAVGRYVTGVLAAVLVLLAVCVGAATVWPYVPDALKFVIVTAAGAGLAGAGEYRILRKKAVSNGFWQALAGCGFMVMFAAVTAGSVLWDLYGTLAAGILYVAWFAGCFGCAGANGSRLFYLLAYAGGAMSMELACFAAAGPGAAEQFAVCAIPAVVILTGLTDAARTDDGFLWWLNAVFAGTACLSLMGWGAARGASGPADAGHVLLAIILLYCSQRLFLRDGGGMAVPRAVSSFLSSWLAAASLQAALPGPLGAMAAVAAILFVFVMTGMPDVLALGSMPVTACMVALACVAVPSFGILIPVAVSAVVLGSGYGTGTRASNLAVTGFAFLTQCCAIAATDGRGDAYGAVCCACVLLAAMTYGIGYKARMTGRDGRTGGLSMAACWLFVSLYYAGEVSAAFQLVVLAAGTCWFGAHLMRAVRGTGAAWAVAALALAWIGAAGTYEYDAAFLAARAVSLLAAPGFAVAASVRAGWTGPGCQAAIAWCFAGAWAALGPYGAGVPIAGCALVLACAAGGLVMAGFRYRRKDVRVAGLALLIGHVLAVAGSVSFGAGTATAVVSLLGAGAVCFGISYVYNRAASRLDDE